MKLIDRDDAVVLLVDLQGKLAELVQNSGKLFDDTRILLQGVRALGVPIVYTEQLPNKMGATRGEISDLIQDCPRFEKSSFSCLGAEGFGEALSELGRKEIILAGIEAHICVCQTGLELLDSGYRVTVVADAVSSRDPAEKDLALSRLQTAGARVVSIEMLLYELMRSAEDENFKEILSLVKNRSV